VPFYCDIRFEPTHIGYSPKAAMRLERWLVSPETIIEAGTPIALLAEDGTLSELAVRFRCQIGEFATGSGTLLEPGAALLRVYADGEEIPSGVRYCTTIPK